MEDIIIRFIKMPMPGVTVLDEDGNYNMYINENLTYEERQKVANHEMEHINKGHFYDDRPVTECEKEAG